MRPWSPDSDEVVKLAVAPSMHRRGIGRLLVQRCIEESCRSARRQMVLISNSRLTGALALYESLGFRYGPVPAVMVEKYLYGRHLHVARACERLSASGRLLTIEDWTAIDICLSVGPTVTVCGNI